MTDADITVLIERLRRAADCSEFGPRVHQTVCGLMKDAADALAELVPSKDLIREVTTSGAPKGERASTNPTMSIPVRRESSAPSAPDLLQHPTLVGEIDQSIGAQHAVQYLWELLQRARDEIVRLKDEGERDYKDMRRMQANFINADHARIALDEKGESMTPEQEALLLEAERKAEILAERDLGIAEFHAMQIPVAADLRNLARELRAALVDAERYRYLRSWQGQWLVVREEPEDTQLHGDVLDAAIDAARAESKV